MTQHLTSKNITKSKVLTLSAKYVFFNRFEIEQSHKFVEHVSLGAFVHTSSFVRGECTTGNSHFGFI